MAYPPPGRRPACGRLSGRGGSAGRDAAPVRRGHRPHARDSGCHRSRRLCRALPPVPHPGRRGDSVDADDRLPPCPAAAISHRTLLHLPLAECLRARAGRGHTQPLLLGGEVSPHAGAHRSDIMGRDVDGPLGPYARLGEAVLVRLRAVDIRISMLRGVTEVAGDAPIYYGRVTTPVVFDRELPDGRLFRNLGEVPRFVAVSQVRKMTDDQFLATKDIDFAREAIITDTQAPLPAASDAEA